MPANPRRLSLLTQSVLKYLEDEPRLRTRRGLRNEEVADLLADKTGESAAIWVGRLYGVKTELVNAGILVRTKGVWHLKSCGHECEFCRKGCDYTGALHETHRCKDHRNR